VVKSLLPPLPPPETWNDADLTKLLHEIEREETPEQLLTLARQLQEKLLLRKQRQGPN
jgi:hypothetical protein